MHRDDSDLWPRVELEIDLSPPTRGQRSLSSRCITGFIYRAFQVACNLQKRSRDQTDQSAGLIDGTCCSCIAVRALQATWQWAAEAVTWSNWPISWLDSLSLITWLLLQLIAQLQATWKARYRAFQVACNLQKRHVTKLTNQMAWLLWFDHVTASAAHCPVASILKSTVVSSPATPPKNRRGESLGS